MKASVKITVGSRSNKHPYTLHSTAYGMDFRNANGFVGYVNRPQNTIVAFDLHGQTASKFMTLVNETNDEVAHRIYEFRKEQGYE